MKYNFFLLNPHKYNSDIENNIEEPLLTPNNDYNQSKEYIYLYRSSPMFYFCWFLFTIIFIFSVYYLLSDYI